MHPAKSTAASQGGVSFLMLLGLLFLGLKLAGFIDWSWWWVLLPFYFPLIIAGLAFMVAGICYAIEKHL